MNYAGDLQGSNKIYEDLDPIAEEIWDLKYRFKKFDGSSDEQTVKSTWHRVANALAIVEVSKVNWETRFYNAMAGFKFLPAGRILSSAGTGRYSTCFNCYVMGEIPDSLDGIYHSLKEAALTLRMGGGIGMDFSTLRHNGAEIVRLGSPASGPIGFMDNWDTMCQTIMSAGSRRGAMMGVLRCDHPDIEEFVERKRDKTKWRNFNVSVAVTDKFMHAVDMGDVWHLVWNDRDVKVIPARELWDKIMRATYDVAEPGVIFIDRMNVANNLRYCEIFKSVNPCAEQPLPPYGACLLGSINLPAFVRNPFTRYATVDLESLKLTVQTAVRMLDNVIGISNYPLPEQAHEAKTKRRMGLGITGLADMLAMHCFKYGSPESMEMADSAMREVTHAAYQASIDLAIERGPFELFNAKDYLEEGTFASQLPSGIRDRIWKHGTRNALLTSIAPTGTISLFAGNVSSGVEPIFAYDYERKVLMPDGSRQVHKVEDYAVRLYRQMHPGQKSLPDYFVTAMELSPEQHLKMQAAVQASVDSSISKTINCPADISFEDFKKTYQLAYSLGLKGCTTYRPNDVTGSVLSVSPVAADAQEPQRPGGLPNVAPLRSREEELPGRTYKLKIGDSHAFYVTINDIEEDGKVRPYEIFINTKDVTSFHWVVALTRMISAVFRRGGDVSFVVEELKSVFDPSGGQWHKGKLIPSIVAGIGGIVEQHMKRIGFIDAVMAPVDEFPRPGESIFLTIAKQCPKCGMQALHRNGGCDQCHDCGYTKCDG